MSALKHIHVQEMVGRWRWQVARRLGLAPEVGDEAWLGPGALLPQKPQDETQKQIDPGGRTCFNLFQYIN